MKNRSYFLPIYGLCLLLVLAVTSATAADAEKNANPYKGAEFRRWSAVVADLDETIHLYTEILGLQLGDVSVDPKTSYNYEVFGIDRDITTRHATFDEGDKKRVLSVVEVPGVNVKQTPPLPRMSIALFNANGRFDEILQQLLDEGYATLNLHALGANGIEVGFLDRDGHLYALYEYPYRGSKHVVR